MPKTNARTHTHKHKHKHSPVSERVSQNRAKQFCYAYLCARHIIALARVYFRCKYSNSCNRQNWEQEPKRERASERKRACNRWIAFAKYEKKHRTFRSWIFICAICVLLSPFDMRHLFHSVSVAFLIRWMIVIIFIKSLCCFCFFWKKFECIACWTNTKVPTTHKQSSFFALCFVHWHIIIVIVIMAAIDGVLCLLVLWWSAMWFSFVPGLQLCLI